jgi:hypothetical protein
MLEEPIVAGVSSNDLGVIAYVAAVGETDISDASPQLAAAMLCYGSAPVDSAAVARPNRDGVDGHFGVCW